MIPVSTLPVSSVRLAIPGGAHAAEASPARAAVLGVVDRVVGLVSREGGFARENALQVWGQLAGAATGDAHTPISAAGGGADVYGVDALGRELLATAPARGASQEGELLRALDDFTRVVAQQVTANRRQPAATALGPVAIAVSHAASASSGDTGRDVADALRAATQALERQLR